MPSRAYRTTAPNSAPSPLLGQAAAAALALTCFALYSVYSYFQYKHFITPSWDLGIFSQLFKAYANFDLPPTVEIKGAGYNLWGDHFHPILVLLTPFYWLFPSPATLLYVQNGLVALSVYIVCRFSQRVLSTPFALALTLAYGLSFGIQNAVSVQFHEVACALPLLALSLGNIATARCAENPHAQLKRAFLWAMPLVFVKEDMGVTVAALGAVILLRSGWLHSATDLLFPHAATEVPGYRVRLRNLTQSWAKHPVALEGTFLIFWGLAWSFLAMKFILPLFNTGGVFDYSGRVDLAGAIADPLQGLGQLFYPWEKSKTLGILIITGAVLWLRSPLALVAVPTLLWRFWSSTEGYWNTGWHYSLVLMPVVFLALLDCIVSAQQRPCATVGSVGGKLHRITRRAGLLYRSSAHRALPLIALLVSLISLPNLPLADLAQQNFTAGASSSTDRAKAETVAYIPEGSTVAADLSVLTYLVPDHTVYWIGHQGEPAPDYVVIDLAGSAWGGNPPQDAASYSANRYGHSYQLVQEFGSIQIAQRVN